MEDSNERNILLTGLWVLITSGPTRVLGRVSRINGNEPPDPTGVEAAVKSAVSHVVAADSVTLNPACDFFAPLRPVPRLDENGRPMMTTNGPAMGMARDPICTTRDFALKPYPVHIRIGPGTTFDFLAEMHPSDQETYRSFIRHALRMAQEASAQASGLVLAGGNDVAAVTKTRGRG